MSDYYLDRHKLRWRLFKRGETTQYGARLADEYIDSYLTWTAAEAARIKHELEHRHRKDGGPHIHLGIDI